MVNGGKKIDFFFKQKNEKILYCDSHRKKQETNFVCSPYIYKKKYSFPCKPIQCFLSYYLIGFF